MKTKWVNTVFLMITFHQIYANDGFNAKLVGEYFQSKRITVVTVFACSTNGNPMLLSNQLQDRK